MNNTSKAQSALAILVISGMAALALTFAFHPKNAGKPLALLPLALTYALFSAIAAVRLHRRGELAGILKPHRGDLSLGAISAALLYGLSSAAVLLLSAQFKPQTAWIMRIYLQLGERSATLAIGFGAAVFFVAAMEEMTFRGLLMPLFGELFSPARAMIACAFLFALVHSPTLFLLADPFAGPNPLLVIAGLLLSLVWGFLVLRYKRLAPALFCHAFFSWALVEFPIFRP